MASLFSKIRFGITGFLMLTSAVFSVLIFLSSFEAVFLHDIKYVYAVEALRGEQIRNIVSAYILAENSDDDRQTGVVGTPYMLKIPAQNIGLRLARSIEVDGAFLAQASRAHYLVARSDGESTVEHMIVYVSSNWRTISHPERLEVGNNIFVDTTDGWRYMHRVVQVDVVELADSYVPATADRPLLLLVVEDESGERAYVARAEFVSVQNIRQ